MNKICYLFSILTLTFVPTTFADTNHESSTEKDSKGMRLGLGVLGTHRHLQQSPVLLVEVFESGFFLVCLLSLQLHINNFGQGAEPTVDLYFSSETLVRILIATRKKTELLALVGGRLGVLRSHSSEVINEEVIIIDENQASATMYF